METSTTRRVGAVHAGRTSAADCLAERFARLSTLLWSEDLRNLRLELDAGRKLLCRRRRNCLLQIIDLLLVGGIRKNRYLELALEVGDHSAWVIRLSAALFRQRPDLLSLSVRQIELTQHSKWRAGRHATSRPASTSTLRRLRYHRNHHRGGQDNRRDAEPYCSFHVEPSLTPY
jgi:hypothetical protein